MNDAYLLLGSNLDKERNLPRAVALLARAGRIAAVSQAYETAPVGRRDQPAFLNAAVLVQTELGPEDVKDKVIAGIEHELGRVRDPRDKNAPRTIDIDIALWNREVREVLGRPLPDPDILRHAYVAVPLADIAPDLEHPLCGERLVAIAARLVADGQVVWPRPDVDLARWEEA